MQARNPSNWEAETAESQVWCQPGSHGFPHKTLSPTEERSGEGWKKERREGGEEQNQTQREADNQENMVQMLTFLDMDPAGTLASSREGMAREESQRELESVFKGKREMSKSCSTQKHNLNRLALAQPSHHVQLL